MPRRLLLLGLVPGLTAAALMAGLTADGGAERAPYGPDTRAAAPPKAPKHPPARVCGSRSLHGPAHKPPGARRVTVSSDLVGMVERAPGGTTFWLTRGVHRLGTGKYTQIRPKSGDRFIGAPGAVIDGGHRNLYAFAGHAHNVHISHLTIQHFGTRTSTMNEGVVNHDSGHNWHVTHSTIRRNGGAGLFLGSGSVARGNCLADNGQYGFSAFSQHGVHDVVLRHNEIVGNNTADWESRRPGCGCVGGGKFWATRNAVIVGNWVHANHGPGIWADTNNTGFRIEGNWIGRNDGQGLMYETSYNALVTANTFVRNGIPYGRDESGFPTGAIYVSESGSDVRAGRRYGKTFEISRNRFIDNWSGVIAWENADRFAGSPANPSDDTTLVNPRVATLQACGDRDLIGKKPYYDDCRWKVQHLRVTHNLFVYHRKDLGDACRHSHSCGYNGLFSNYGTYPSWSPYRGTVVERHITLGQDNRWSHNHYVGPWHFMALELGNGVSWHSWRGKFGQDHGSVRG